MKKKLLLYLLFLLFSFSLTAQVKIELGSEEMGENQAFTISIVASNDRIKTYDEFPDIEGFTKRGTSSSSSHQIINGQVSSSHSITMSYSPSQQGVFILKPFSIRVNGDILNSDGTTIRVGPPVEQRSTDPFRSLRERDPFEELFGKREEPDFVDVQEDAFLSLGLNKKQVYVGEGVTADLSFYVSDDNRAILQFYELGRQLSEILKVVKPANAWEENFNIENINGEAVTINGKRYTQYKIYEATFYPFNSEDMLFPSVGLEMIKYKVARNPSFFGTNRQEDYKTFYSREKTVAVRELPPHPLKDMVAVGDYRLYENLDKDQLNTGESFKYDFRIYGVGNISSIEKPVIPENDRFDFYSPNVAQKIDRKDGRVSGSKTFSYYGIPNEPGRSFLGDYFSWIYFNPRLAEYDTLRSKYFIQVDGESRKNESIQATDLGDFYDRIEFEENLLASTGNYNWMTWFVNIFVILTLLISVILIFRK